MENLSPSEVESELISLGYAVENITNENTGLTDKLFTRIENDVLYAAWEIAGKGFLGEWFVGVMPASDLNEVSDERRLDLIDQACTVKAVSYEVEGILENFNRRRDVDLAQ